MLFRSHYSLLARQVAERNAETGEHYITRDRAGYEDMLRRAAGGGAVIAGTVFAKFASGWEEYRFAVDVSGLVRVFLHDSSAGIEISARTGSNGVVAGTWGLISFTYDGRGGSTAADGISVYVNGADSTASRSNSAIVARAVATIASMLGSASFSSVGRRGPRSSGSMAALERVPGGGVCRCVERIVYEIGRAHV